jgi:hypothetical protein
MIAAKLCKREENTSRNEMHNTKAHYVKIDKTHRYSIVSVVLQDSELVAEVKCSNWLSTRLALATERSMRIEFTPSVLETIEPDIVKCRQSRDQFRQMDKKRYGIDIFAHYWSGPFIDLAGELNFGYDTAKYALAESFTEMLGLDQSLSLNNLHARYSSDRGRIKERDEKRMLLQGVTIKDSRRIFHDVYVRFVLEVIAPHVRSVVSSCNKIYFQSFPCIRVVRPGEFSIGPHCDAYYGFSQANINFYVPLTSIYGTNSLILESGPGKEDWHTIELGYGEIKRFYGAQCAHFTPENTTSETRVSLDFRMICDDYWQQDHDHFTSIPGYYSICEYQRRADDGDGDCDGDGDGDGGGDGVWALSGELPEPDWRVGFPFVR